MPSISLVRHWMTQNTHMWLRPLVVLGVLLLSFAIPLKASDLHFILIIGMLAGLGVVLAFWRWPSLGLIALVGTTIIPFDGPSGLNATMVIVVLLLGLWVLDMLVYRREIRLVSSRTMWPLLGLLILAGVSFGVGQLPWFPFAQSAPLGAQLGGLAIVVLSVSTFLLVAHQLRDVHWLERMTWLFLAMGGLYIAGRLISGLGQLTRPIFEGGSVGSLFWVWLIALSFSQAIFNHRLHPIGRLALVGLVLAALYVAYVQTSSWKSGWVPPLVTIAAIIGFRWWRLGLVIIVIGLVLAPDLPSQIIATDEYSYATRVDAWLIMIEIIKASPILGLGFANYNWYTPLFRIRGYAVRFNSHNQYIDLAAQMGLLGLACFLWFAWELGRLGWRLRERVPSGFPRAYVYGALGGLIGTLEAGLLGDWVLPFFYNVGMSGFRASVLGWLFLGGLVALEYIYVLDKQAVLEQG
jgi:O-antigen ligase